MSVSFSTASKSQLVNADSPVAPHKNQECSGGGASVSLGPLLAVVPSALKYPRLEGLTH